MSRPVPLQAAGLSAILPDGRILFSGLELVLRPGACALIGRNGQGKSTLLRLLAGPDRPPDVRVSAPGGIAWLRQDAAQTTGRVVDLLGFGPRFDALARLSAGDGDAADVERVGDDWELDKRLAQALAETGLPALALDHDAARLSAGQRQQLRLLGAWMDPAEVLLLDEPGTWLDAEASRAWSERMRSRPGALLVVSHDPVWLEPMPRLLELRTDGLLDVDGGLDTWRTLRATMDAEAGHALASARAERDRMRREASRERERIDRRGARGRRDRRGANQSALLLDHAQDRSERSAGRRRLALDACVRTGEDAVTAAWEAIDATPAPVFLNAEIALSPGRRVLAFDRAHPCNATPEVALSWVATGPARIVLRGRNGSGKTTLLRALRGECGLAAGQARALVPTRTLDALLPGLPPRQTALDWLQARTRLDTVDVGNRLALLGLPGIRARQTLASLSGGERMRVALAAAAWAQPAAPLLLLDEPASHLDFDSVDALVALLRAWPGALLVVSHDDAFVDALTPDHCLELDADGLRLD